MDCQAKSKMESSETVLQKTERNLLALLRMVSFEMAHQEAAERSGLTSRVMLKKWLVA